MGTTQAPAQDMFDGEQASSNGNDTSSETAVAQGEQPMVEGESKNKVILPREMQQQIELNRQRNQMQAAIRGTTWGKDLHPGVVRAVSEYCRLNNLDPQRHVEVLGGRIYLTATLYEERGAPLILAGIVTKAEPEHINADPRLDEMAKDGDEWAKEESKRRKRLRVKWNVPEKAAAVVVQRFKVNGLLVGQTNDTTIVGVNWCGGGIRKDPVGDAEPSKTAESRAARRAWKQIADAVGSFGEQFEKMEAMTVTLNNMLVESAAQEAQLAAAQKPRAIAATSQGGYVDLECRVPDKQVVSAPSEEDPF
ncbi:MAG: hypothetical protein ACO1Q7_02020 [Gemmatimonas sp.]